MFLGSIYIEKYNMPRKKSNLHYIYKTTCLVTNRYYIGMHSTCNVDDGYMGSGKRLRYSIRKYGVDNHEKEVLEFFENRELLIEGEINIITDKMVSDPNCMNLRKGGTGGFTSEQQKLNAKKSYEKQCKLHKDIEWVKRKGERITKSLIRAYAEGRKEKKIDYDWNGKKHSTESKGKIGVKNSIKQQGSGNSQYNTSWITNGIENKKIPKNSELPVDWKLGRSLK
jgi:hypothetical protein